MPAQQSIRGKRRHRGDGTVKLQLTSMIDMFTLMVVFLIQNYSSQGQLVTPAQGLVLPKSTIQKSAGEALSVAISQNTIMVEKDLVIDAKAYAVLKTQQDFMIPSLYTVLSQHSKNGRKSAEMFKKPFSGKISIQGDEGIPYNILTRVMYTCGQAGYPNMNLVVYSK
ncbi:MAG: biopolymer transporter ExbD [Fibrobacterota bacterium]